MRGFGKLAFVEFKLLMREPAAFFFSLVFPLMMLFIFGTVFGNSPRLPGGFGSVDLSIPAYTAMIIATTGIMSLTITISSQRELGILRRLHATPLRPTAILLSHVIVLLGITTLGMVFLVSSAYMFFDVRFDGNVMSMIAAFLLSAASFLSLGFFLASLLPTARTAVVVAQVIYYPMLFFSGAAIPKWVLPEAVKTYGQVLPLTQVVNLLTGLWTGESWGQHSQALLYLTAMMAVCLIVSAKVFRWE